MKARSSSERDIRLRETKRTFVRANGSIVARLRWGSLNNLFEIQLTLFECETVLINK